MNINVLKSNNPYLTKSQQTARSPQAKAAASVTASAQPTGAITSAEADYFKGLFPQNAKQIDSYIAFNSRGGITTAPVKGSRLDITG